MKVNKRTALDFSGKRDIFTLDDIPKGFLQVLLTEFTLTKEGEKEESRLLDIALTEKLHAIVNKEGKNQFFDVIQKSPEGEFKLKNDIKKFNNKRQILSSRFDCSSHPLRYGNGGVLPIIRWKNENDHVEEYFCFFYRDIFPIGWNIANGASDALDELRNPELILFREFGEELLIRDDEKQIIYTFDPGRDKDPGDTPSKALKVWEKKHKEIASYTTLSVPMTWIKGTDSVRVRWAGGIQESGGYFLNIVPDDNAIEVDRVALINVNGKLSLFDGEQSRGIILNRAVGLFKTDRFRNLKYIETHDFKPDVVFYDGNPGDPEKLIDIVSKKIEELKNFPSPFRNKSDQEKWESSNRKLDLCPITRMMVYRYIKRPIIVSKPPPDNGPISPEDSEVFISYRSSDQVIAQGLHDYLESCELKTFLSAVSLPLLGESDYATAIDHALESAKCLVVLGTHPECFDSGWVGYEWRSFLNEIRSGRKKNCQLFSFISGVEIEQLPFALRSYQMIPFISSSPQDAFDSLTRFIQQSMKNKDGHNSE